MTVRHDGPRAAGELRHVDKWYGDHHVLVDVSVRIGRGEIVALIGRSGSGKSTVLRVLAGLSTDHTGERVVAGAPGAGVPGAAAVPVARRAHQRRLRTDPQQAAARPKRVARADRALADVGLCRPRRRVAADAVRRSGATGFAGPGAGRRARAAAARRAVRRARRADPVEHAGLLLDLWREHGFGVLLVTHDVDEAVALADRVLVLDEGRVVHTLDIDDPRRRRRTHGRHEHYRAELLDKLGVQI